MAIVETFKCDVCGIQKQESNHWWKASKVSQDGNEVGMIVAKWDTRFRLPALPELQGVKNFFDAAPEAHLCGHECVIGYLSKNLLSA